MLFLITKKVSFYLTIGGIMEIYKRQMIIKTIAGFAFASDINWGDINDAAKRSKFYKRKLSLKENALNFVVHYVGIENITIKNFSDLGSASLQEDRLLDCQNWIRSVEKEYLLMNAPNTETTQPKIRM